jgi:hypothetical protein
MIGSFAKSREIHKILNFFLQNLIHIWWFFCKIQFFCLFFLGFAGEENDKHKPFSATTHPKYLV